MNEHLEKLFASLNSCNINYVLLTDFEFEVASADVDLYVDEKQKGQFEEILLRLGWFKRKEPSHHINHFFYYRPFSDVYIDVKYNLNFADGDHACVEYKNHERVFKKSVKNAKGIYRPFGIDAIVLYAAHLAFKERGTLEEKHKNNLSSYIENYRTEVDDDSAILLQQIYNWLHKSFPKNSDQLKKTIRPFFNFEFKRMTRDKNYSRYGYGLKVLFLGTDGAGKTTLMEAVKEKLNLKTKELYLGMGNNGWTCSITKKAYKLKFNVRLYDRLFNFLKTFFILPIEFFLRILPVKFKSRYSVVLIDRFPGSVFLNKKRSSSFIYNLILPKPDLVFFLHADPEVLIKRKPDEVTLESSIKDIKRFEKVADVVSNGNYISIDTSKLTIPEARDFVISEIYKNKKVYDHLLTVKLN
jgi:thymidylate kinase